MTYGLAYIVVASIFMCGMGHQGSPIYLEIPKRCCLCHVIIYLLFGLRSVLFRKVDVGFSINSKVCFEYTFFFFCSPLIVQRIQCVKGNRCSGQSVNNYNIFGFDIWILNTNGILFFT